jgi:hypothetical protein
MSEQIGEDSDDNDEWYEQMANQTFREDIETSFPSQMSDEVCNTDTETNEMEYYNKINEVNSILSDEFTVKENDLIWQSMIRQLHSKEEQKKLKTPSSQPSMNSTFSGNPPFLSRKIQSCNSLLTDIPLLSCSEECSSASSNSDTVLLLLQQWLFSHLPFSSNVYHLVTSFLQKDNYWANSPYLLTRTQQCLLVDNILHPSFIVFLRWNTTFYPMTCHLFTSLSLYHQDHKTLLMKLFQEVVKVIKNKYDLYQIPTKEIDLNLKEKPEKPENADLNSQKEETLTSLTDKRQNTKQKRYSFVLAAIHEEFYDIIVRPFYESSLFSSIPAFLSFPYQLEESWDEFSWMWALQDLSSKTMDLSDSEKQLLEDLSLDVGEVYDSDAVLIDAVWKYRSDWTIHLVSCDFSVFPFRSCFVFVASVLCFFLSCWLLFFFLFLLFR